MITKIQHLQDRVALTGYARANALGGDFPAARCRAVSPVNALSTGGVRPLAGISFQMGTRLVDTAKGGVRLRSLEPPI